MTKQYEQFTNTINFTEVLMSWGRTDGMVDEESSLCGLNVNTYESEVKPNEFLSEATELYERIYTKHLKEKFEKAGILNVSFDKYSPNEYNFATDSIDITFDYDDSPIHPDYREEVENYIDNYLVRSYDGYWSFETTDIEEVGRSDQSYLHAILATDFEVDDINKILIDMEQDVYELRSECTSYYEEYSDFEVNITELMKIYNLQMDDAQEKLVSGDGTIYLDDVISEIYEDIIMDIRVSEIKNVDDEIIIVCGGYHTTCNDDDELYNAIYYALNVNNGKRLKTLFDTMEEI